MQEFTFYVTQPATSFYTGVLNIKADSIEEARAKIESRSNDELNDMVTDWKLMPDGEPNGPIEVWGNDGKLIIGTPEK